MHNALSDIEMARIVEFGEAAAYSDLYAAGPSHMELRAQKFGTATALRMPLMGVILFNRVIGLGIDEPATAGMLDDIEAFYRDAGLQKFAVQLSPAAQPASLPQMLQSRKLMRRDNWTQLYRRAADPPKLETVLRVEMIGREHAPSFSAVASEAFGMPALIRPWIESVIGRSGWTHYLAFEDDEPVATGALFIKDRIGWLGFGSTLADHRGHGAQGALMALRIQDGIRLGCDWLITETGEDRPEKPNASLHNMLRTGFHIAYLRPNYILS